MRAAASFINSRYVTSDKNDNDNGFCYELRQGTDSGVPPPPFPEVTPAEREPSSVFRHFQSRGSRYTWNINESVNREHASLNFVSVSFYATS